MVADFEIVRELVNGEWVTHVKDAGGGGGGSQDLAQVLATGGDPEGNEVTGQLVVHASGPVLTARTDDAAGSFSELIATQVTEGQPFFVDTAGRVHATILSLDSPDCIQAIAPTGYTGTLLEAILDGTTVFKVAADGEVTLAAQQVKGVADPTDDQDAATKAYVDAHALPSAPAAGWGLVASGVGTAGWLQPFNWDPVAFGADPTGVADSTAALDALMAEAPARSIIAFGPGIYKIDAGRDPAGYAWKGAGPESSILRANAANDTDFFINTAAATGQRDTIFDGLGFDGQNLTGTGALFKIVVSGSNAGRTTFKGYNCWLYSGPAIGVDSAAAGGALSDTAFYAWTVHDNGGIGWNLGSDQLLDGCIIENNGEAGVVSDGHSSWRLVGVKSYSNGTADHSGGYGYHLIGESSGNSMAACQAQDNFAAGILFDSMQASGGGVECTGFVADSNSQRGDEANAAVEFFSAPLNKISFTATDRNNGGRKQSYAVKIDSASKGNRIDGSHYGLNGVTVQEVLFPGSDPSTSMLDVFDVAGNLTSVRPGLPSSASGLETNQVYEAAVTSALTLAP